ncbi:non-homologous end joining protein Ku [Nakamurella leprariae]|uniref:Non-homologous end joining protein Ku n=1 Tax=Nakamurella leprariae TaxID=2803911 RepID=A0A939C2R4_9ACTN|nr:Ku protein [Nakamurella leprariae]MBM9468372.1 Ku protein [Nakamurella leprariae]
MARAIWTGVLSFGLVSVPVGLYSATSEHEIRFHQFEAGTTDRIRYQRVNERTGKEVDYADIVRGTEVGEDGELVLLDQDELDSVAPGRSRSLDIETFVDLEDIDPIHYQKTYYLGPATPESAKVYGLLRDAMARTDRAAIGSFVMRGKEYLATVRADGDLLLLHTMFFADEIRDAGQELPELPKSGKAGSKELKMAQQLIESMTGRWDPEDYRDTYTDRVAKLVRDKAKGRTAKAAKAAPEPTEVVDLLEALRRSVQGSKGGSSKSSSRSTSARKSTSGTGAKRSTSGSTAKQSTAKQSTTGTSRKSTTAKSSSRRSKKAS